jgi:uncharacterized membrane protein YhaH (DUF805 family)
MPRESARPITIKSLLFSFEGHIPRRWYWAGQGIMMGAALLIMLPPACSATSLML